MGRDFGVQILSKRSLKVFYHFGWYSTIRTRSAARVLRFCTHSVSGSADFSALFSNNQCIPALWSIYYDRSYFFSLQFNWYHPGCHHYSSRQQPLVDDLNPTAAFRNVDRSLEEAALDVGASPFRVFVQITLPLVFPAIAAAVLLSAVNIFYEAQASLIIGLPYVTTVPVLMYSLTNNQLVVQYGAILMFVTWVPSLLLLIFAQRFLRGRYFAAGFGV